MRIVCFGDSLTSCGGEDGRFSDVLADRFPAHTLINSGAGGETFVDGLARVESDVLAHRPEIVLIEFGANDWWKDERPNTAWAADLENVVRRVKEGGATPVVLGVFGPHRDASGGWVEKTYGTDARALAYREMEREVSERWGCPYIANIQERIIGDRCCWRDTNHPNEYGNRHVADVIEPVIVELTGSTPEPVRRPTLRTTRDMWDEAVALAPERLAAVDGERRVTFAEAGEIVGRLAAGLLDAAGCERPKVAIFLPNCLEYFLLYWATVRLGGVVVPFNTWLKEDSLSSIFHSVAPDVLVVRSRLDAAVLRAAESRAPRAVVALDPEGGDLVSYASLLDRGARVPRPEIEPEAGSIIMHTSGTTAAPKGAVMRHSDLVFNVMTTINAQQFSTQDVHLLVNPMFHCTALYSSLPSAAYQKTPVIITADAAPDHLMGLVERERITTFLSVPSIFMRLIALPNFGDYDCSSLRLMAYAGSPMPASTIRQLQELLPGVELHNFFGLTETTSATHVLLGDEAEERPDSIGRLLPFVRARIVAEGDRQAAPNEVGELLFARDNVISGYYNQPGRLEESVATIEGEEWFRTGDLASVDEEGYFFVKGRQKDMIIVGGENVYAAEVEAVIMLHDKVREAAVRGVKATGIRASLGELIKAYVVRRDPSLTEAEVRKHCFSRLPSYKIPHMVEFLDELPRNPAGKVVKAELP